MFNLEEDRNSPDSTFGELFFSWMAASLLHDIGYDIERAPEEEAFRKNKNNFWDFMTQRATTADPLMISINGQGQRIIEDYILADIANIPGAPKFSYREFQELFLRNVPTMDNWKRYDHGLISAIKYLLELENLQRERNNELH